MYTLTVKTENKIPTTENFTNLQAALELMSSVAHYYGDAVELIEITKS